jgi:hypothetical protein
MGFGASSGNWISLFRKNRIKLPLADGITGKKFCEQGKIHLRSTSPDLPLLKPSEAEASVKAKCLYILIKLNKLLKNIIRKRT